MKRRLILFSLFLLVGILLAGCGEKSQEDVTSMLEKKMEEMTGYKTEAKMTLDIGKEPQSYDLEIWHKKKGYYRVVLNHEQKKQNQMIIRNDEGVFVLTPALNKSFRFQSEWPENSSQTYLYESLVSDILNDKDAKFKSDEKHYIFETKTNYQNNKTLPYQEVTLSKDSLMPVMVKVMDQDRTPLVQVDFTNFKFNPSYDEGAFDVQRNMTGAQLDTDAPTMAQPTNKEFKILYPLNLPEGVGLVEEKKVETEDGERMVLTYGGDKSFTLYQEKAIAMQTGSLVSAEGEPVDLGFAIGAMTDRTLSWSFEGVDYYLASKDLTQDEMVEIARSVQGQAMK
ncbi:outer membrane lipoprotein carrier protein LolA [Bacillus tianshenii]|nr:outer membrane lipoprotein carrier protein LolA [Bacillus tianshenii]